MVRYFFSTTAHVREFKEGLCTELRNANTKARPVDMTHFIILTLATR
jgi:hypothetical protein